MSRIRLRERTVAVPTWRDYLRLGLPLPEISGGSVLSGWLGMQLGLRLIYDTTLAAAATSHTISGLDGDRDQLYLLVFFFKGGAAATTTVSMRPNNDSGTNYGYQYSNAASTVVAGARAVDQTGIAIASTFTASGRLSFSQTFLYAKSGNLRPAWVQRVNDINLETIDNIIALGYVWNNSADNITSLVIVADQTNGLGVDTRIMLFALR